MKGKKAQGGILVGVIAIIVVIVLVLLLGFDVVDANHLGVMNKFGVIKGIQQPGMQWTGLFTQVYQYNLRTRPVVIELAGKDSAATSDGQSIYATIKINWRIKSDSVMELYKNVGKDVQVYEVLNIEGRIKHGFKTVTVQYEDGLDIIQHRDEVIAKAILAIQEKFPTQYTELEYVVVQNIYFAPEYQAQIDAKKAAEQEALKEQELVGVAIADANKRVAKAEGDKQIRIKAAEAEKFELVQRAEGEAKALELKSKQLDELMVANNWIDAWRAGGAQVPTFIMGDSGSGNFLYQMPVLPDAE